MATKLMSWPIDPKGCIHIIKEDNKTYTVEHSDLYAIYCRVEGFKKFKQAKQEADCWRNR